MNVSPGHRPSRSGSQSYGPSAWLVGLLLVLVGVLLFRSLDLTPAVEHDPDAEPRAVTPRGDLAQDEKATIELFKSASPSVVHITSLAQRRDRFSLNLFEIPQGTGTGFVWDEQGHVVTNYHVVRGANSIQVQLNGELYRAVVVGRAPDQDVAVLKIDAPEEALRPLPLGTSSDLQVGQKVFAIGNPFGLDQTLTTGVISGLGREIESVSGRPIEGVIQTDASINPGNSGGPLLDSAGRLIGVNTAIYSPSGADAGIGFAVPVDMVNLVVPQLLRSGNVERPGLGVTIFPDELVDQLVQRGDLSRKGVLVRDVTPGSAAQRAGLESTERLPDGSIAWGDLIVGFDGEPVKTQVDLFKALADQKVGDEVQVTVLRDGREVELTATLQALPTVEE